MRQINPTLKGNNIQLYVLYFWAILVIVSLVYTLMSKTKVKNDYYSLQIEASEKTKEAFDIIKEYKIDNGFILSKEDDLESFLIGESYTPITIAQGYIQSKKTTINPNFGALFIKYFMDAGLKQGDEIAIIETGSFPAANIALVVACEVYNLKYISIVNIGTSGYGANDPTLTYADMVHILYEKGAVSKNVDYYSFEGIDINNEELLQSTIDSLNKIKIRLDSYNISFINDDIFEENVKKRCKIIEEDCPNLKLLINIGGSKSSIGINDKTNVIENGLSLKNISTNVLNNTNNDSGLLEIFYEKRVNCLHILNIKGIVNEEGLEYNQSKIPDVGNGDCYYKEKYKILVPIFTLIISLAILIYGVINKYNKGWKY